jgi:hypothetical protein
VTVAPRTSHEFIDWLVTRHPALVPVRDEHLSDNGGELLTHVLFGDVSRYALDLARRASDDQQADVELIRLLHDLDRAIAPAGEDDAVENLIWVSFVENAQGMPGDADEPLRNRLRAYPNLARAISHYE